MMALKVELVPVTSYRVAEWCPEPSGVGPPEQVHLILQIQAPEEVDLIVRFTSSYELDRMVAALARHRESVWGPPD